MLSSNGTLTSSDIHSTINNLVARKNMILVDVLIPRSDTIRSASTSTSTSTSTRINTRHSHSHSYSHYNGHGYGHMYSHSHSHRQKQNRNEMKYKKKLVYYSACDSDAGAVPTFFV